MSYLRTAFAVCLAATLVTGCFLKPKKKSGGSAGRKSYSVILDEITMTRIGDGTSARLGFQTKEKVFCEMAHYSQEDGGTPSKDDPVVTECPNDEPRNDFLVRIDGLETDTLYWVKLTVYPNRATKEPKDEVLIQEEIRNTNPDDPPNNSGKYESIYVARMNVALETAEVHRHAFAAPKELAEIKLELNRAVGCKAGIPNPDGPFRTPASDIEIESLATTSFGADKSQTHPEFDGIRRLEYNGLNLGLDQWKFIFTQEGQDVEIKARSGNTIQSIELTSTETALLPDPQLAEAVDPLPIDAAKDLVVKWETDANLLASSYVLVYVGRSTDDKSIFCTFKAEDKRGSVPASLLEKLTDDRHVVLVMLESSQFLATEGWFVSTYDWRSGRIEKL